MKKTLVMITAAASMLAAAPGNGMMQNGMGGMKMPKCMCMKKMQMQKKQMNSPFLIKHGLPHLTKMIMPYLNDPAFNLTAEQKQKLAVIRKETIGTIKSLKPEVMKLRKEIVQASTAGAKADTLKEKVDKLASLEAKATMAHLNCIEKTKEVLTKDQLLFLLANKNKSAMHGKKKMMMKKMKMMKCASGKCGGKQ